VICSATLLAVVISSTVDLYGISNSRYQNPFNIPGSRDTLLHKREEIQVFQSVFDEPFFFRIIVYKWVPFICTKKTGVDALMHSYHWLS